ncbi:MAG: GNAT family N-acetyltransferase [Acidobacteriaceae bacterium]|nr:GNAT family N-acetyltransferase [Acidobacteriaceae bacterium]
MSLASIRLRRAEPSDLAAILALERATENAPHWPPKAYADLLATPDAGSLTTEPATQRCMFVAETPAQSEVQSDFQLVGFAVGFILPADDVGELESVVVASSQRRAGVGRALCSAVFDWCRAQGATEVMLEVRSSSVAAIALYTSMGFTATGRRPRYYSEPEDDALLLRLPLTVKP